MAAAKPATPKEPTEETTTVAKVVNVKHKETGREHTVSRSYYLAHQGKLELVQTK
jgi:hypothetical protein